MSAEAQPQRVVPASRRRDKPILSCTLCRRRKLKCDRNQPCRTCVDRGLSLSCTYVRSTAAPQAPKAPNSVHDRIDQLEKLVTSLMGGKDADQASPVLSNLSISEPQSDSYTTEIPGTPDRVILSDDTTSYTNSGHWTSILDGISELREHLDHIPTSARAEQDSQTDVPGPDLLFGRQIHVTKQEILAALPPRLEVDQLIETYFASMDTAPTLLHRPTFLREYNDFWHQPFETSTMWLGLLYAILALGARFQATLEGSGPASQSDSVPSLESARMELYREKVVQCLVLANYTKCPPYTVEAFLLYFGTEYLRSADTQFSMWVLVSMITRVAFRMGYHREPSRFPNISPFRAEMRRRIWMVIMSLDLVSSSSVGLPRMIYPFMYDCQEPRNLTDEDIHEDMVELPPARPETELTQLLYSIVLTRVRNAQAKVMDFMNATVQPPYREIMDLDQVLRHVYDKIPHSTKAMPAEHFNTVISPTSMRRLYLGLSFLKAEIMLHRPYLVSGRTDSTYEYSRRVCLNAALEMLDFQQKLDAEVRPGGKLWSPGWQIFTVSWYMSSIAAQDFLLATSVLILDLDEDIVCPLPATPEFARSGIRLDRAPPTRQEIVNTLRNAHRIWFAASARSHEARKVAAAVRLVLHKVDMTEEQLTDKLHTNVSVEQSDLTPPSTSFDFNNFAAERSGSEAFAAGPDGYCNPFVLEDMPMNFGDFTETFNWTGMATDLQVPSYVHFPPRPFLE
ncbi:fungal-specific transcription factor domain-containing protein [Pyrenochaeta sp. MPI-SDFR-AT-0127]|nr:fungal-specific transcription factor domain-containing protein [Pyrenochaeta sp. MPI-SDFR-AT-0127]